MLRCAGEMRQAYLEKAEGQKMKQKARERMQPKMGKLDIDYQVAWGPGGVGSLVTCLHEGAVDRRLDGCKPLGIDSRGGGGCGAAVLGC